MTLWYNQLKKNTPLIPFFIYSHKQCICSLFCSACSPQGTSPPPRNTNNSLTSPPKQFMTTVIISQQQSCLKARQKPTGIVMRCTQTSVSVHERYDLQRGNRFRASVVASNILRWRHTSSSGFIWLSDHSAALRGTIMWSGCCRNQEYFDVTWLEGELRWTR